MNKNKNRIKKNYKGNRGGKPTRETKDREAQDIKEEIKEGKLPNDPSFYFGDPKLMEQALTFSFNQFLRPGQIIEEDEYANVRIASICRMWFNPSIGWCEGDSYSTEGINVAARQVYAKLSSMNAKTTQYLPNDISTLLLLIQSVIEHSEFIRRAFGIVFCYNRRNWGYPSEIIRAMGIDPDDFYANLARYRLKFNTVVMGFKQVQFPMDIPAYKKAAMMYSNIWLDSTSPMAGSYLFLPDSVWTLNEDDYEYGSILKTVSVVPYSGVNTMEYYINQLNMLIVNILKSATFNYIFADVLRFVNDESQLVSIPFIDEGYFIQPEYDPIMLLQINNATWLGKGVAPSFDPDEHETPNNDIYPAVDGDNKPNGNLIYKPRIYAHQAFNAAFGDTVIVNFPHSEGAPDITQRVEATRMMVIPHRGSSANVNPVALPDHYVTQISFTDGERVSSAGYQLIETTTPMSTVLQMLDMASKFAESPRFYGVPDSKNGVDTVIGDLDFFTTLDYATLKTANDLAFIHMYTPNWI